MKKRWGMACILLALSTFTVFAGCKGEKEPQTIIIPSVSVDLSAPENKVEVPSDVVSYVYDSDGNMLTSSQWLLNSKFAKEYIRSLGVGEYAFTYKSASAVGTITLIVTDSGKPKYVFRSQVPSVVTLCEQIYLPELVKEQDSYQAELQPEYTLLKGDDEIEVTQTEKGILTPILQGGDYVWCATLTENSTVYEYTQSFHVTTFEEWMTSIEDEMLYCINTGEYVLANDDQYVLDASQNTDLLSYTISNDILKMAMKAGKSKFRIEVISDKIISGGSSNNMYIGNDWPEHNRYIWNFAASVEYEDLSNMSDADLPRGFGMEIVDEEGDANYGKYKYWTVGFLNVEGHDYFDKQALRLDFANGANPHATVTIMFE